MKLLVNATPEQQRRAFDRATVERLLKLDADFEMWAHRNQLPPSGEGWRTWLMMAGRGFGKTRAGAEWIHRLADGKPGVQIARVGATIADARSVMIEGVSGLLKVARAYRRRLNWEPSVGRLRWPNGSEAKLFSGDSADGLRGPEHDFAWFLTFETLGEEGVDKVPLSAILADASNGSIEETGSDNVVGYAAYGANVRTAIAPIIDTFALRMFDDGERIRSASAGLAAVAMDELGNSADQDREPRFRRELLPAGGLPSSLRLGFYDEARDFQSGEARAAVGETTGPEARREFPAVIPSDQAKQLAQEVIAREWAERDRMSLRLPKRFLAIEPGAVINVPLTPARWVISRVTIEGFVPVAELRPEWLPASSTLAADSGRLVAANDVAVTPVTIALFEVSQPASSGTASSPARFVAASSKSPVWRRRVVTILAGHSEIGLALAARKAVLGTALAALPDGQVAPVTEFDEVEIELIDPEQWLESRDETALAEGANLAMVGREVIQFASAIPLGAGRFRLGRLGRGKGATEQEMAGHVPGEPFVLLEPATLAEIELPPWLEGLPLRLRATPDSIPPIALHSGQSA